MLLSIVLVGGSGEAVLAPPSAVEHGLYAGAVRVDEAVQNNTTCG